MDARSLIVAEGVPTRLTTLRSQPPLTLRATAPGEVHLVGSAAGPVGGDDLSLVIEVCGGAELTLGSVAASLAQPDPLGRDSAMRVTATVAGDSSLTWTPEPLVLVRGCRHRSRTAIDLVGESRLWWADVVSLGRAGELSGSMLQSLRVRVDGVTRLASDQPIGPAWAASTSGAALGDHRGMASVVSRGVSWCPPDLVTAAAFDLGDGLMLWQALGPSAGALAAALVEHRPRPTIAV